MAIAREHEHFALDWIKSDLIETLNTARVALDDYAEQGAEETRLRACLTSLHQLHGTLLMLELQGVTLLADHLEQMAQALLSNKVADVAACCQALMQGILEMPGYLDELQRGAEDSPGALLPLVNEMRELLQLEPIVDVAGGSLTEGADAEVIDNFNRMDGQTKVMRMRSAYQSVLLSILKGEERTAAVNTLGKIAAGLERLTEGASMQRQWQAFGEFVNSLTGQSGALESNAVRLLRRVDLELKNLAVDGVEALQRPANVELVEQLLDAAQAENYSSETVVGLRAAVERDSSNNTLAISGRQALATAAIALRDELAVIKDRLDLLVRSPSLDLEALRELSYPLKQIGSTLSLLGFESSREIISDQIEAIENIVVLGDGDPAGVQSIAGALMQIDENLNSVSSERSEIEQITSDAQLQLLREARKGLELVKTCVVDFVTAEWDVVHLQQTPETFREICGALDIIPLPKVTALLHGVAAYVEQQLMQGHKPDWQELDVFADALSGVDYFLERLADENTAGMEDILLVAQRSVESLAAETEALPVAEADAVATATVPGEQELEPEAPDLVETTEAEAEAEAESDTETESETEFEAADLEIPQNNVFADAGDEATELQEEASPANVVPDALDIDSLAFGSDAAEIVAADSPAASNAQVDSGEPDEPSLADPEEQLLDETKVRVGNDDGIELALEEDADFDLSGDDFADIAVQAEDSAMSGDTADTADTTAMAAAEDAAVAESADEFEAAATAAADHDVEAPDPEIVEIFLEEVGEVLESIDEWLPQWAVQMEPGEPLSEVRRAFHTLKGSGRIVQAAAIGELAWGIENMLNRVIDDTVTPNEQFVTVIRQARDLVPSLCDAYEQGQPGDLDAISAIIEQADLLASGGELPQADDASAVTDAPVADSDLSFVQDNTLEALETIEQADAADEIDEIYELGAQAAEALDEQLPESAETDTAPSDLVEHDEPLDQIDAEELVAAQAADDAMALFGVEAQEYLSVIEAENRQQPWTMSEPLMRALHTLAGSAATAGVEAIRFIVEPANQVVNTYRGLPASQQLQDFFVQVGELVSDCLQTAGEWEDPVEIVAAADDLIAAAISRENPLDKLLSAPATGVVFAQESALPAIVAGEADSTELLTALADIVNLAGELEAPQLGQLGAALLQALTAATINGGVNSAARQVIGDAYSQLIDVLNSLAVDEQVSIQPDVLQALESVDLSPEEAAQVEQAPEAQVPAVGPDVADETVAPLAEPPLADPPAADTPFADSSVFADATVQADNEHDDLDIDEDLVEVFFEEAEEICEALETSINSWSGERSNRIYLENILRGLHTLKGGARLCGLSDVGDMSHDFETIVIEVQNNERDIDDELFKRLNSRYDAIVERLAAVKAALAAGETSPAPAAQADELVADEDLIELPQTEDLVLPESLVTVKAPSSEPPPAMPARAAAAEAADSSGDAAKTERPPSEMVRVGAALLEDLVNLAGENSILRARIEQGMSDFTGALDEMETTIERLREQLRRLEIETETQVLFRHERNDTPTYENFDPLEMDRYSQLQQLSRGLSESASDMLDLKDTLLFKARESETLLLQQARINTELQEGLMRTRMVPFNRLLPRLRRIVRQVSGELDKEIDFHVQNAEGELDRNLLERMVPPLEHMLRNAVDHGIETAEIRRNFGKPATGRIDLRLSREGGDVVIEISDDGAGIDVENVRAKAIERELCTANAVLSDDEVMQFILAPGFSTAKSVTQISGRGVGMDVVHSEVKQLGGSISISSRLGQGTRITLRVPFTVSVNRALMVSVGEDLYAIPLNTIEGIVLLSPEQVDKLHGESGATFEYAGVPYRLRYMGQYLGREYHSGQNGQTSVPVVLVRSGDHAVAIHVDAVSGSREIVVKSLGPQFAGVGGISGATILGDGNVVVILDLHALIRAQRHHSGERDVASTSAPGRPRCVLVVDDSVTVRKVTSRLLERQGMDVIVAKDGVEAVALLQERRPDVMLLDIEMPRMDGFEVARQVRHDDRLTSLPIVMISSRTGDKHKEHASQLGVNKFLGKPFQENELLATIDELVTRS